MLDLLVGTSAAHRQGKLYYLLFQQAGIGLISLCYPTIARVPPGIPPPLHQLCEHLLRGNRWELYIMEASFSLVITKGNAYLHSLVWES